MSTVDSSSQNQEEFPITVLALGTFQVDGFCFPQRREFLWSPVELTFPILRPDEGGELWLQTLSIFRCYIKEPQLLLFP